MVSEQGRRIKNDPDGKDNSEKDDKSPRAAESGYFVRDALAKSQAFFFFQVRVARNLRAQKLICRA